MAAGRLARTAATLLATVLAGSAAACSTEPKPRPASMSDGRGAPAATADPQAAQAATSALSAYAGYLSASREAALVADPQHPQLRAFLGDPLLTRVKVNIRELKVNGAVRVGSLSSDPTVTDVDLRAKPPTVMIQDCIDTTGYRMVYAKDRKPVPGSAGGRYVATATATRYPDGRWLISDGVSHLDQPC